MRRLPLLALPLLLFAMLPAVAHADGIDPNDFEVDVEMGPGENDMPEPDCKPESGRMRCAFEMSFSEVQSRKKGTVRNISRDLEGTMDMTCDFDMKQRMVTSMPMDGQGSQEIEEFSGSGRMSCNWLMDFGEGTSLAGIVDGVMKMGIADREKGLGFHEGNFSVEVVAGTGAFADNIGKGSWSEHDEFPIMGDESCGPGGPGGPGAPDEPGGPDGPDQGDGPDGDDGSDSSRDFRREGTGDRRGGPQGCEPPEDERGPGGPGDDGPGDDGPEGDDERFRAHAAAKKDGSLNLRLRKGRARARIVAPGKRLARKDKRALRVAAARGSRCKGLASKGGRRVSLGSARDKGRRGEVRFRGAVARKLRKGTWRLEVRCAYKSGGKSRRASTRSTVKVA